ncbi:hypothetical protein RI138_02330 [Streptomyces sp. C11-1]|uniref:Integral membrane protein n=1 Tax=Streptomyces durocortorensis TaxID=2811104 RepID=A0ABY9VQ56_9ACTN|nr:hypothetical protein [Streptomyces durocortorensis]WNF25733.1 hypothetical protein RI138_02330 [Streptomyces durocortorensis]
MFLPLLVGAVLAVLGVVFRSRLLVLTAGIITLGFAILWMVRQGQAEGSLTVTGDSDGLGSGVGLALLGGLLMLTGAAVMGGRERRAVRKARDEQDQQERNVLDHEDRDSRGAEAARPYDMAARDQETRDVAGAGSARRTPSGEGGPPQRMVRRPEQQASAPRGLPVPARDSDSGDRGREGSDRTQYEQNDAAGRSHDSKKGRSGGSDGSQW